MQSTRPQLCALTYKYLPIACTHHQNEILFRNKIKKSPSWVISFNHDPFKTWFMRELILIYAYFSHVYSYALLEYRSNISQNNYAVYQFYLINRMAKNRPNIRCIYFDVTILPTLTVLINLPFWITG